MTEALRVPKPSPLRGRMRVIGDKSITHRAYILAGLAEGESRIAGPNPGEDCGRTRAAMETLGARIEAATGGEAALTVRGVPEPRTDSELDLDCGNSGTTLRLLAGALAGHPVRARLFGDESLSRRPVRRIVEPLRRMGAHITAASGDRLPPVRLGGGGELTGIDHHSEVASAQVKSCVLLAGLRARGETSVTEPVHSRDHTERMLPHWGVPVERHGLTVKVQGGARLKAASYRVPGDPSAAIFWIVAAILVPGSDLVIDDICLNPTRMGALEVLERMGARIEVEMAAGDEEPRGSVRARSGPLRGAGIPPEEIPALIDELPILAVAQAAASGESRVRGAAELKVKESDRIEAVAQGVRALGAEIETTPDGWRVQGRGGRPFKGGRLDGHGDHRIVMSFAVAGLAAESEVEIEGAGAIATSDPSFLPTLRKWAR